MIVSQGCRISRLEIKPVKMSLSNGQFLSQQQCCFVSAIINEVNFLVSAKHRLLSPDTYPRDGIILLMKGGAGEGEGAKQTAKKKAASQGKQYMVFGKKKDRNRNPHTAGSGQQGKNGFLL